MDLVGDVHRVVIERGQGAHHPYQHRHRVRVAAEALEEARHLLVNHGVAVDGGHELLLLLDIRELAVQQQVADLEKVALHRELLDRIAAVQQHALVAVDVGDAGAAARGCEVARVESEHPRLSGQRADVDHIRPDGAGQDRQLRARLACC